MSWGFEIIEGVCWFSDGNGGVVLFGDCVTFDDWIGGSEGSRGWNVDLGGRKIGFLGLVVLIIHGIG